MNFGPVSTVFDWMTFDVRFTVEMNNNFICDKISIFSYGQNYFSLFFFKKKKKFIKFERLGIAIAQSDSNGYFMCIFLQCSFII